MAITIWNLACVIRYARLKTPEHLYANARYILRKLSIIHLLSNW